ncbi:MAG TPA: murein L,D-transpeptidase catalytic domain family protein [Variovorax sp.]|nr:murein L,D-transpeptidase catalytic domain family protein [Variovorax sp.]
MTTSRASPPTRRFLLASAALAGIGWIGAAPRLARAAIASPDEILIARARSELERLGPAIPNHDLVAIADYALPSSVPRFHLLDMREGRVLESLLVAHGRGSDPQHIGRVQRFSNEPGSNASSEGAYRTGERYLGKHGRSIRLAGLDGSNSNAEPRAIVIHSAWYVGPTILQTHGKLGRSEGCFVFSDADHEFVLDRLGPDRLLLSGMF